MLLGAFVQLRQHLVGDLDAGLVFAFVEQRGQHHAADRRDVLGIREGLEEGGAVFFGGHHLADHRAGADQVVEVVLALPRLGVVELELLVGGVGTADVAVGLVDEGGGAEQDGLVRVAAGALLFEGFERLLEVGFDQGPGGFLHAGAVADAGDAGLEVFHHHLGAGDQLIEGDRAGLHLGPHRVGGQFQEQAGIDLHLEGLDHDLGAVLVDEGEQGFLVALGDDRADEGLEAGDDPGVRGAEADLVLDRGFEVLDAFGQLAELEVADREADVEGAGIEGVAGLVAFLEELLEELDGLFVLLRALAGLGPAEQGALVEEIAAAFDLFALVRVVRVAGLEGLLGVGPALELELADSLAVPGHAELGPEEGDGVLIEEFDAAVEGLERFFPIVGLHRGDGGGVEGLGILLVQLGRRDRGGQHARGEGKNGDEGEAGKFHRGKVRWFFGKSGGNRSAGGVIPQGRNGPARQFLGSSGPGGPTAWRIRDRRGR